MDATPLQVPRKQSSTLDELEQNTTGITQSIQLSKS